MYLKVQLIFVFFQIMGLTVLFMQIDRVILIE